MQVCSAPMRRYADSEIRFSSFFIICTAAEQSLCWTHFLCYIPQSLPWGFYVQLHQVCVHSFHSLCTDETRPSANAHKRKISQDKATQTGRELMEDLPRILDVLKGQWIQVMEWDWNDYIIQELNAQEVRGSIRMSLLGNAISANAVIRGTNDGSTHRGDFK